MVKGAVAAMLLIATPAWAKPPASLACVQRFYAARAIEKSGLWYVTVPDGSRYLYDFGGDKPFEERLRVPDVQDMFGIRYKTGAIVPITEVDEDPGRIRHAPLFDATYPPKDLVRVKFFEQPVTVQKKITAPLERVAARLRKAIAANAQLALFFKKLGASQADRQVAGTATASAHTYGIAIDLNPELSTYWRWQKPPEPVVWANKVPQAIVDAFEAEGFVWGGRWYHYDTGHFEYRPELIDPACYD